MLRFAVEPSIMTAGDPLQLDGRCTLLHAAAYSAGWQASEARASWQDIPDAVRKLTLEGKKGAANARAAETRVESAGYW